MASKEYSKQYYLDNREKFIENAKENYKRNREKVLARVKVTGAVYYKENKEKINKRQRQAWNTNKDGQASRKSEREATRYRKMRIEVFDELGGEKCVRCGYTDWRALQVDHINGGGQRHIRSFSSNQRYFAYVKTHPHEFQVLCANCNRIKVYEKNEFRKAAHEQGTARYKYSSEETSGTQETG